MDTITIYQVRNAVSLCADNTRFEVEINHPEYGWIPYHLRLDDTCQVIDNNAILDLIGTDFTAYLEPTQAELDESAANLVSGERNSRLETEVDPIVSNPLRWSGLTETKQAEWTAYRKALLDITDQTGYPHNVNWPTKPE